MTIRGEFEISGLGPETIRVPNQFTTVGMQQVLKAAFWQQPSNWWIGLCAKNPADAIALASMNEPTIGVNLYARQSTIMNQLNWADIGVINGESYVESRELVFPYGAGPYDKAFNRLFITDGALVIAVSAAIDGGVQVNTAQINTRYRLFFR